MAWWLWAIAGIALLAVELSAPGGLFALFFGIGALAVAPLAAFGLGPVWQWLLFSAISLASLALLRRTLLDRIQVRPGGTVDGLVGEAAVPLGDVPPGGEGRAELRGVPWTVRAPAGVALRAGQRCTVERVEGVTLWVRPE
jgi:membrane protein implicated in regulation of membrane protease activity